MSRPRTFRQVVLPAALVILTTLAVTGYLLGSIARIKEALPLGSLTLERDFSVLLLDVGRLETSLAIFAMAPSQAHRDELEFALDLVALRLRDNKSLYAGSSAAVDRMQADLSARIADLGTALQGPDPASQAGASLASLKPLREQLQVLNHDIFQTSMSQVTEQRESIAEFRDALVAFVAFAGTTALVLLVLLLRHRRNLDLIRRRESELRASEALLGQRTDQLAYREAVFQALFDQSDFLAGVVDGQGRLIEVNRKALAIIDQPAEAVLGTAFVDTPWWLPDARTALAQALEQALAGQASRFETVHPGPGDGTTTVIFHTLPVQVRDQRLIAVIGVDISARKAAELALASSERRYRSLVEHMPLGITVMDRQRRILMTNRALADLFRQPVNWCLGKHCYQEYEHRDAPCPHCPGDAAMRLGIAETCATGIRADGSVFRVHNRAIPYLDEQGEVDGFIEIVEDITARQQLEDQLKQAASVFEHANEGIMITDPNGVIVDVNAAFTRITGYRRDQAVGQTPRLLKSGRHDPAYYAAMWQALRDQGSWSSEIWNRRQNGEIYAELQTISAVRDQQGQVVRYVSLFSDITSIKTQQRQLEQIAHYDILTGLPNRMLLADRMKLAMAHCARSKELLAVCVMDLDGFKPVNDSLGHKAGDAVLQEVAYRMHSALRAEDTAARLGGDEFALLLGGFKAAEQSEPTLRRLLESVAQPLTWEGQTIRVTGSLGVTFYQGDDTDADQLLRRADQAMYLAKEKGKNRFHWFDTAMDLRLRANQELYKRIEKALDQGQFRLYYQPKVDCRDGRIAGLEALIRWQHPTLGLRGPAEFIPLIEHHDLIIRVGDWVIAEALRQMAEWRAAGLDLPVSVNVTVRQFVHGSFGDHLRALLGQYPAELANRLHIELVETAALEDINTVSAVISDQQRLGIGFALDDFGTGYSSLVHLKRLAVDELKIDQTFVRDILVDAGDMAIAQGVIGLGAAFGHRVVAEGVESTEQILVLLELGCALMQGYALSRPMPAAKVPDWCRNFQPDPRWRFASQGYPSRENFELLLMAVEHRRWLASCLEAAGEAAELAAIEPAEARFSLWCRQQGLRRPDLMPLLSEAEHRYDHVRRLAGPLGAAIKAGNGSARSTAGAALELASQAFLADMEQLRSGLIHEAPKTTWSP